MEELLSAVTKALAESPDIAVWVLAIIYLYKTLIVGSVYGVIRFSVAKFHDVMVNPKRQITDSSADIKGLLVESGADRLVTALKLLHEVRTKLAKVGEYRSTYLHRDDVEWLIAAIQEKHDNDRRT